MFSSLRWGGQKRLIGHLQQHLGIYRSSKPCEINTKLCRISSLKCLQRDLDKLFKEYNIQESIDTLHQIVTDAKDRKASGTTGTDTWKDGLNPRVAVAARTVAVLTSEADRLRAMIDEVCSWLYFCSLPESNYCRSRMRIANLKENLKRRFKSPTKPMKEL